MPETINQRIARYRKLRGYSQAYVADYLGLKSSTYSQRERSNDISCDMLIKLAFLLEIDVRELLFGNYYKFTFPPPEEKKPEPEPEIKYTTTEKNIIKILRNMPASTRKETIIYINQKYNPKKELKWAVKTESAKQPIKRENE